MRERENHLSDPRSQKRAYEILESLKLSLDDDETKIGSRVRIARVIFYELNLAHSISRNISPQRRGSTGQVDQHEPASAIFLGSAPSSWPATAAILARSAP